MRIRLQLGEALQDQLRLGDTDGRLQLEVAADATPSQVLQQIGAVNREKTLLVIVNGSNVPPSQRDSQRLAEGDEMLILPPLKGG